MRLKDGRDSIVTLVIHGLGAAQSIPLNIAEGNGKRSLKDRGRFLDVARGSALECAAIQDVLAATGGLASEAKRRMDRTRKRIVAMLTRMAMKFEGVAESQANCHSTVDYEHDYDYDYGCEHEHEHEHEEMPEPDAARERPIAAASKG